jgi:hypothetical protein
MRSGEDARNALQPCSSVKRSVSLPDRQGVKLEKLEKHVENEGLNMFEICRFMLNIVETWLSIGFASDTHSTS